VAKKSLTVRIEELEKSNKLILKNLRDLETTVHRLITKQNDDDFSAYGIETLAPDQQQDKRIIGRPPRIPNEELRRFRNELFTLVKAIEERIKTAIGQSAFKSAEDFVIALIENCPARSGDLVFQHLIEYYKVLWEFINSDRYSGNVLTIADAMAGVPKLTFRYSLDRCSMLGPPEICEGPF
jgi:hypothetical protein